MNAALFHYPFEAYAIGFAAAFVLAGAVNAAGWLYRRIRPEQATCPGCRKPGNLQTAVAGHYTNGDPWVDAWHDVCLNAATRRAETPYTGTQRHMERLVWDEMAEVDA